VEVPESDGSVRGLDVFGGFLADGRLHLMGEIRTPFERDWVLPLGTATLEGRPMPVPADTDRFLTATYGPDWRVPDPAYKFDTPRSTRRRLTGWFRGTRMGRDAWEQDYERRLDPLPPVEPSDFARWVVECEDGIPERVVDIGCGRALDDLWFAREGSRVLGLDYLPQGARQALELATEEGADLEVRMLSLGELRSVLAESARLAHEPGRRVVTVRHTADATDADSRERLWRACSVLLRASGRVYVEVLTDRGDDGFAAANRLRPVPLDEVAAGVRGRGARVVSQDTVEVRGATGSHQVGRLVATWAE
jgi:SAM-dependent methyltransferase